MKNRGFTLVELLAVVVILSIIALILVPNIVGNINNYRDKLNDTQIKNIESAARVWGSDNLYIMPNDSESTNVCYYANINNCESNYKTLVVTLSILQNAGYIGSDLKDIKTNQEMNELEIHITKNGNRLDYQVMYES